MSVVTAERVVKRFGSVTAVDGIDLAIPEGSFTALLGPSGCGKTTLLRMIAGFETPDEGQILIDGQDMTGVRPAARPVNLMFQSYALFPHMTVAQNIAYGLEMERLPRAEIRAKGRQDRGDRRPRCGREQQTRPDLRRAAPTGGPCPGAGKAAEGLAA